MIVENNIVVNKCNVKEVLWLAIEMKTVRAQLRLPRVCLLLDVLDK